MKPAARKIPNPGSHETPTVAEGQEKEREGQRHKDTTYGFCLRSTSSSVLKFQKNQPWPASNAFNFAYARLCKEARGGLGRKGGGEERKNRAKEVDVEGCRF